MFGLNSDWNKTSMTLEQYWEKVANSNREGDPNTIDKKEEEFLYGSIYFVEEGMTKEQFLAKNQAIYDTQPRFVDGMLLADSISKNKESLTTAVSRVVNQMLDKGEFASKKHMILEKISYLDDATQTRVLQMLEPNEQNEVKQKIRPQIHKIDDPADTRGARDGDYGVKDGKTYKYDIINGWQEIETE